MLTNDIVSFEKLGPGKMSQNNHQIHLHTKFSSGAAAEYRFLPKMLQHSSKYGAFFFFNQKLEVIFFSFIHKSIYRGASNEYPQHRFLWRNKKNM